VLDGNGTPRTVNESLYGNPWTFTGRRLDQETGLMYFRNRMYDTGLGRFIGRDPNDLPFLYVYCLSNPSLWIDPFGLKPARISREIITPTPKPPPPRTDPNADYEQEVAVGEMDVGTIHHRTFASTSYTHVLATINCEERNGKFVVTKAESDNMIIETVMTSEAIQRKYGLEKTVADQEATRARTWEDALANGVKAAWNEIWQRHENELKALEGSTRAELEEKIRAKWRDWMTDYARAMYETVKKDVEARRAAGHNINLPPLSRIATGILHEGTLTIDRNDVDFSREQLNVER
jgi:RHS repeat-associated protein